MKIDDKRAVQAADEIILCEGRKVTADCVICSVRFYSADFPCKESFLRFLSAHLAECVQRNNAGEA